MYNLAKQKQNKKKYTQTKKMLWDEYLDWINAFSMNSFISIVYRIKLAVAYWITK